MGARIRRYLRVRLTHYWDQHPLHELRLKAAGAGMRAILVAGLGAVVLRFAPAVVVVASVVVAGLVAGRHALGLLLEQRRQDEENEWSAVRLLAAARQRQRTIQRLLDAHVPPELHAELIHQVGVYRALEDEYDRLGGRAAVEVDGILIHPRAVAPRSVPRPPRI